MDPTLAKHSTHTDRSISRLQKLLRRRDTTAIQALFSSGVESDTETQLQDLQNLMANFAADNDFETLGYAFLELPKAGVFLFGTELPSSCARISCSCSTAASVHVGFSRVDEYTDEFGHKHAHVRPLADVSRTALQLLHSFDVQYAKDWNEQLKHPTRLSCDFFSYLSRQLWSEPEDSPSFENVVAQSFEEFCQQNHDGLPVHLGNPTVLWPFLTSPQYQWWFKHQEFSSATFSDADGRPHLYHSEITRLTQVLCPQLTDLLFQEAENWRLSEASKSSLFTKAKLVRLTRSLFDTACAIGDSTTTQRLFEWLDRSGGVFINDTSISHFLSKNQKRLESTIANLLSIGQFSLVERSFHQLQLPAVTRRCLELARQQTVKTGNFDIFQQLTQRLLAVPPSEGPPDQFQKQSAEKLFDSAIRYSRLDVLDWLLHANCQEIDVFKDGGTALEYAIQSKQPEIAKRLLLVYVHDAHQHRQHGSGTRHPIERLSNLRNSPIRQLFETGQLELLKWCVMEPSFEINLSSDNEFATRCAARFGHLDMLKWLVEAPLSQFRSAQEQAETRELRKSLALPAAARNGRLSVVRWLIEDTGLPETILLHIDEGLELARKNHQHPVVRYLSFVKPLIETLGRSGFQVTAQSNQIDQLMQTVESARRAKKSLRF